MPQPAWKLAVLSTLAALTSNVSMAAKPAQVKDVSRQIEVIAGGRLRETAKGQGELTVSVWNKSKAPIAGPLFLVIDDTGMESVTVGSHAEETAQGKPVFEIVSVKQMLPPGGMSKSLPIAFHLAKEVAPDEANKLQLKTRVFGREAPLDEAAKAREQAAREDADFATRGKSYTQADLDRIRQVQQEVSPELVKKPDVIGTAISEDSKGSLALRVYTETRAAARNLPSEIAGFPVEGKPVVGGFDTNPSFSSVSNEGGIAKSQRTRARENSAKPPSRSESADPKIVVDIDQQLRFDRPVPIGVSAFNAETTDTAGAILCASGTLGCRCIDLSGKIYSLSNAHVYSDFGFAALGQSIVQPSQGDNGCVSDIANNTIGNLVATTRYRNADNTSRFFNPNGLPLNVSDAALAEVVMSVDAAGDPVVAVGVATPSDGYGTPSKRILLQNRLGLQVQKYGRTTGYTRGFTTAVDVYSPVGASPDTTENFRLDEFYGMSGTAPFSAGGDSGSLIVTLADRRPISLLFAGSDVFGSTLGNKIGPVLDRFNVRVDDGSDPAATTEGDGNIGLNGRGAVAIGNISSQDLDALIISGTVNGIGAIIAELLPPELRDRVRPNTKPLIPVNNGLGTRI